MNENNNANPSNNLNGNTTGEMDMIGEHTILCTSTDIGKNSSIQAQAIQVTPAQAHAAHHRRPREHGTTITSTLFSNPHQTLADKTLVIDTKSTGYIYLQRIKHDFADVYATENGKQ